MSRPTALGILFLVLGLFLLAVAVAPIGYAIVLKQPLPQVTMLFLAFVGVGITVAVFGALLIPDSHAKEAATNVVAIMGQMPGVAAFVTKKGGDRAGDPPADPPKDGAT